ncbi:MAG: cob(I)yrinic acid a,c-diamide adenosyltransferase [Candidatus Kapabacteria bacterium]|nr:cob(I)yrinic acid a,c-diamide adenosyltransferase [Candidatus Kapabacteria bacterium]
MSTRIYTKTGDDGSTGLFGGIRVRKDNVRIEAYGTVDELNSIIGVVRTCALPEEIAEQIASISSTLFTLGADLATPLDPPPVYAIPRIGMEQIEELERWIDRFDGGLEPLKAFILPGGTVAAAHLHVARTICRRAERLVVTLATHEEIGSFVVRYLNRLSDYLFMAARAVNASAGVEDVPWQPNSFRTD